MSLLVNLHINDISIGSLNIYNLGGNIDGECNYEVTHHQGYDGPDRYATFTHNRPDGALACIRSAIDALEGTHND